MPFLVGILASRERLIWYIALCLVFGMVVGSGLTAGATVWKSIPMLAVGRLITGCVFS
jgi:hypothetical protein